MTELTRPPLEITLRVDGEPRVIKMTYGLFNEIMVVVPSPEQIADLLVTDNGLRDYVIRRMLTGNKKVLKEEDLVDSFDVDIDITELDALVTWVGDHVMYFFITAAQKTAALGQKYQPTLIQLAQSKTGAES